MTWDRYTLDDLYDHRHEASLILSIKRDILINQLLDEARMDNYTLPINYNPVFSDDESALGRTGYLYRLGWNELVEELHTLIPRAKMVSGDGFSIVDVYIDRWSRLGSSDGHMDLIINSAAKTGMPFHIQTSDGWIGAKFRKDRGGVNWPIVLSDNILLDKDAVWPTTISVNDLQNALSSAQLHHQELVRDDTALSELFNIELKLLYGELVNLIKGNPLRNSHTYTFYRPESVKWENVDMVTFAMFIRSNTKQATGTQKLVVDYVPETDWITITVNL